MLLRGHIGSILSWNIPMRWGLFKLLKQSKFAPVVIITWSGWQAGVRVYPLEMYAVNKGCNQNKILLGYGNVNEEEIMAGIID